MSLVPQSITALAETDLIGSGKNIVAGASVSITKSGGGSATIYSDAAGTATITLPTVTDSSGELLFYIESGSYIYTIAGSPYPVFVSDKNQVVTVETFAALATTPATTAGMVVYLKQHTSGGIGGGRFFIDKPGSITNNGGTLINNTVTAGRHWECVGGNKTPYEFGYLDGDTNAAIAINSCTDYYGECYLNGGKTYNIQTQVKAVKLKSIGKGYATLNCTSPTANNRFGETGAAVYVSPNPAYGDTTNLGTLKGAEIEGIKILCNRLINSAGSTGLKGFVFFRCENFSHRNCYVDQCASYAYWDTDVSGTGTIYCSGTRDDCIAIDAAVSFEQVNVRGIALNNCYAYTSTADLGYVPECQYHAYGGSDMRVEYNNCVGIADGVCPVIISLLLTCKNINVNGGQYLNNNDGGGDIRAAVMLEYSGGDFDRINFNGVKLASLFYGAVLLNIGSSGSADSCFKFSGCDISGYQIGVAISSTGGKYEFTSCNVYALASGDITPFAYYNNGAPSYFKVIGGIASASGGAVGLTPTNFPLSHFNYVSLTPAGASFPVVRQKLVERGVFDGDGSTYSVLNVVLPSAVLGWISSSNNTTKISAVAIIDVGISGAADAPSAAAMAQPVSGMLSGNNIFRFYAPASLTGKTLRYEITEYY